MLNAISPVSNYNFYKNNAAKTKDEIDPDKSLHVKKLKRSISEIKPELVTDEHGRVHKEFHYRSDKSFVDSMRQYASDFRAAREKSKEASLEVKKIDYNSKSISSKLSMSKTSASAKQVVSMGFHI